MKKTNRTIAAVIVAALAAPLPVAVAKNDRDVIVRGSCTGASTAKLKLSPENGRIEVEFEVDQNRNGVAWRWALARPGKTVRTGTARTVAPSGSFEVRRVLSNLAGRDTVVARATRANGEVCTVRASL